MAAVGVSVLLVIQVTWSIDKALELVKEDAYLRESRIQSFGVV